MKSEIPQLNLFNPKIFSFDLDLESINVCFLFKSESMIVFDFNLLLNLFLVFGEKNILQGLFLRFIELLYYLVFFNKYLKI